MVGCLQNIFCLFLSPRSLPHDNGSFLSLSLLLTLACPFSITPSPLMGLVFPRNSIAFISCGSVSYLLNFQIHISTLTMTGTSRAEQSRLTILQNIDESKLLLLLSHAIILSCLKKKQNVGTEAQNIGTGIGFIELQTQSVQTSWEDVLFWGKVRVAFSTHTILLVLPEILECMGCPINPPELYELRYLSKHM